MGPRRGSIWSGTAMVSWCISDSIGRAGGDLAEQRDLAGGGGAAGRQHLDRAALVVGAADVALALEVGQVLVHRGQRLEAEPLGDLLEARRIALLQDVALQVRENFALALGQGHRRILLVGGATE